MKCKALLLSLAVAAIATAQGTGIFDSHQDIGVTPKAGAVEFKANEYRVTGGGANIWGTSDAMHLAWKRVTGDFTLTADVRFEGQGVDPHRKAVLMARQSLEPGAAYADIAIHGDGLTSLQYRLADGGPTQEIRSAVKAPVRIRIERRGDSFTVYAGPSGSEMTSTGPQTVKLANPAYVGIGVSSHNVEVLETAVFSNVRLELQQRFRSKITIYDTAGKSANTVYEGDGIIEAPNWSRDGKFLLVNTGGNLYRLPVDGERKLEKIELGEGYRCNNDHDFSPDGKLIAFSASSPSSRQSQVYVANADGTGVKLLTPAAPSYFHGWSPDGKWLAFVGQRGGKYELFRVPVSGGPEQRLTSAGAYDDGPEYSPDGKWIYFNSNRTGAWNIWRMPADGAGPNDAKAEQVTSDEWEDWFPHFSPDGKRIVFLSFPKGTAGHNDRMEGVVLRMMPAPGEVAKASRIDTVVTISGGQGTINVNSWSPDSTKFAYVVYEPVAASSDR